MSFLTLTDVDHVYFSEDHATTAVENISMSIEQGEFVSFLGPSGCGKTTILSIIAGLIKPTSGIITLDGNPDYHEKKEDIGYMLQQDYLFPWKTIKENILLGLKLQNKNGADMAEKAVGLLAEMGLRDVEGLKPGQLSGGMRQRVALIRTLATDPKLLLLDEPFSALDYVTKLKLEDLVSQTLRQFNKTAILVTHDIGEAIAMSDWIYLLAANPGRLRKVYDIPDELRRMAPFESRNHPQYSSLFQTIWKEFERSEG